MEKIPTFAYHYFLDEAGDPIFYGKGRVPILGQKGVSNCFILGLLKVNEPPEIVRRKVVRLQKEIAEDPYYRTIPSIQKKRSTMGYFLHANNDIPEVRKSAFELIRSLDCNFEAVVARKIYYLFEKKHNRKDTEFYADLLSHLLKNKLGKQERIVLTAAYRSKCTALSNLQKGLNKALMLSQLRNSPKRYTSKVVFNVQKATTEPLLNIADYFCWAVQRVFETGETRYYDFISDKISVVWDIYDFAGATGGGNYYSRNRKLTEENCINEKSPKMH